MANMVLVHGIDQQQFAADPLEQVWVPALAGGLRAVGYEDIADRLWRNCRPGELEIRMAFYGDVFQVPDQQGDGLDVLTDDQTAFAEQLAVEWLRRAAQHGRNERERRQAAIELANIEGTVGNELQGMGAVLGSAIAAVTRIPWFARVGMGMAERFIDRSLRQVTHYLTIETIRTEVQDRVKKLVGKDTKIIIGHSLGSVVAYEVAHQLKNPLSLLLTLGSPLGLDTIVYQKVRPQPPSFPLQVKHWLNVADRNDFIAARPDLSPLFSSGRPPGSIFDGRETVDNGPDPHRASFYLTKRVVGQAVGEALKEVLAQKPE